MTAILSATAMFAACSVYVLGPSLALPQLRRACLYAGRVLMAVGALLGLVSLDTLPNITIGRYALILSSVQAFVLLVWHRPLVEILLAPACAILAFLGSLGVGASWATNYPAMLATALGIAAMAVTLAQLFLRKKALFWDTKLCHIWEQG